MTRNIKKMALQEMCVNCKSIKKKKNPQYSPRLVPPTQPSAVIFSVIRCVVKNFPQCSDIWMACFFYRITPPQAIQAAALQLICPRIQTHTTHYVPLSLMRTRCTLAAQKKKKKMTWKHRSAHKHMAFLCVKHTTTDAKKGTWSCTETHSCPFITL